MFYLHFTRKKSVSQRKKHEMKEYKNRNKKFQSSLPPFLSSCDLLFLIFWFPLPTDHVILHLRFTCRELESTHRLHWIYEKDINKKIAYLLPTYLFLFFSIQSYSFILSFCKIDRTMTRFATTPSTMTASTWNTSAAIFSKKLRSRTPSRSQARRRERIALIRWTPPRKLWYGSPSFVSEFWNVRFFFTNLARIVKILSRRTETGL